MPGPDLTSTRGILRVRTALENFRLSRAAPSRALAPFVDYFWILDWDLRDRGSHHQQVLPHPSVHMTFVSDGRSRITGVVTGRFTERIEGLGRVVGVRFRPGGFRPFLGAPVSTITDRTVAVEEVFGPDGRDLAGRMPAAQEPAAAVRLLEDFLTGRAPAPDPVVAEAAEVVDRIAADPSIVRVDGLAAALGVSTRGLQRMFRDYVGAGPKWVIRRYRLHEAADQVGTGVAVNWALLAAELGYADQAHLTRDFTAAVGMPPAQYAKACADGR